MITIETTTINGTEYLHTYSNEGYMIERDGIQYAEAIDPLDSERTYTETNVKIEKYTPKGEEVNVTLTTTTAEETETSAESETTEETTVE